MKIIMHKSQKSTMLGKVSFLLNVKGQLSDDEMDLVKKYNLGGELLVHHEKVPASEGLVGSVYKMMKDTTLTTNSLINGTVFTCKNVAELIGVEEEVIEASKNLRRYIHAADGFGGDEVVDIDALLADG